MSHTAHTAAKPPATQSSWSILVPLLILVAVVAGAAGWWWKTSHAATASSSKPDATFQPVVNPAAVAPAPVPAGMVWIPGGKFFMGCEDPRMPDARPIHPVELDGFYMDETPVTNAEYAKFVDATRYVTVAERTPDPKDFPGAPPENLVPGSCCFTPPKGPIPLNNAYSWWRYQKGANWRHPEGPSSDIKGREDHPVVHVAWEDAAAYAKWAGKRLPTEAEFEYAARGGMDRKAYAWGDDLTLKGKWVANIWQGHFPDNNLADDGFVGTSPVKAFPANAFGLYDVGGNVWQWCADWYRPDTYAKALQAGVAKNPTGPEDSYDPEEPGIKKRVQRSGSFLCSDQYCVRYLVGSRGKGATDSGASNAGFRCAKSK